MKLSYRTPLALFGLALACAEPTAADQSRVQLPQAELSQQQIIGVVPVAGPPAPTLVGPDWDAKLTGPTIRFRWQPGTGQTTPVRYEICVSEVNQPCPSPTAAIYRPTGDVIDTEPVLSQPTLRPKPGEPGFGLPPIGQGSAPPIHFLGAVLPPQFKGKRLQWIVAARVPDARPRNFAPGTPPPPAELCTASPPRIMSWSLSVPTLRAPAANGVLSTLNDPFSWDVADAQGIEFFLICFATRGAPCAASASVQPNAVVAQVPSQVQVPRTFTPSPGSLELGSMMGETLEWTVAACNSALGCTYQPVRSAFHVPIMEGSWDSIYAVTQDAKCKNCHQMFAENEVYRRHIDLGRFTREENKSGRTVGGSTKCNQCHTAALGFADGWRFPSDIMTLDRPRTDPFMCSNFKVDNEGLKNMNNATGAPHALKDPLIRWAVNQMPGLGHAGWVQRYEKWSRAGRLCCSSPGPRGCGKEPPHGQFGLVR